MRRAMRSLLLCLLLLLPVLGLQASVDRQEIWLLVDDETATMHVYRGDREIAAYSPISLGRGGAERLRLRGDRTTPTGEFRINWINRDSRFHIFLGLDYPTLDHAREAREAGIFSDDEFYNYLHYYRRHGAPPQDTVLGGNIGIHGLGEGDPEIHERFHWTDGCVAVTNEQIERLAELVRLGTRVIIR